MEGQLAAVVVGAGVAATHPEGAHGTVVGTFRHGCYVQVNRGTYAVAGPAVVPGPIHLIVDHPPPRTPEGLTVWRRDGLLCSTEWQIDLERAAVYAPLMPGPATLRHAAPSLRALPDRLAVPEDLRSRWDQVSRAVAAGDLVVVRELLEGRGGGLTPTGDDVLAGVLLVHAWRGDERGSLAQIAEAAATTNLSRSFLAWASRGQSLAPVHDLVASAALDDRAGFDDAVTTVSGIGASSGTALLWGIALAATAAETFRAAGAAARTARSSP